MEWKKYIDTAKILVGKTIVQFLPKLAFFKKVIPEHITHKYSESMSKRSTIISLPIIDTNEAEYSLVVTILCTYEKWIAEIYHKAGLLEELPYIDKTLEIPGNHTHAGQAIAHTIFTEDDLMRDMKIVFAGKQLTQVRFAGAKDLLTVAHTPSDRLEHCSPFKTGI